MEFINTDGIVLKVRHTGESDRIVTVLTRNNGVINAFAKSARRPKSKLHTGTQTFCFSEFTFSKNGDVYKITEAAVKEVFFALNDRIENLSLAQYFGQLASDLIDDDDRNPENLRLILNSVHFLCRGNRPPSLIKAITEMRLCVNAGYAPDLTSCGKCGREIDAAAYFDVTDGTLCCSDCAKYGTGLEKLSQESLRALRHIAYADFASIYSLSLAKNDLQQLVQACERYLLVQTERTYSSLVFYKSIPD